MLLTNPRHRLEARRLARATRALSLALAFVACDAPSGLGRRSDGLLDDGGTTDASVPLGEAQIGVGRAHDPAWVTELGGDDDEEAFTIHVSSFARYVGGDTTSSWFGTFNDPCGDIGEHTGENCADAFLVDYDDPTRGLQLGGLQSDSMRAVTAGADFVFLGGKSREGPPRYQNDGWMMKYPHDLSGPEWRVDIANAGRVDEVLAMARRGSDLYVAGGSSARLEPPAPTAGNEDAFILRLGTDGVPGVTDQFGSPQFEEMMGIAADASRVYTVGQTGGYLDDAGGMNLGSTDAVLLIRNTDVVTERCRLQFGTSGKDVGQAVAISDQAVFVAGWTEGAINGASCELDDAAHADAFVSRYDRMCNHVWTRQFGTVDGDIAEAIATDGTHVYVAGDHGGGVDHGDEPSPSRGFLRTYSLDGVLEGEILFDAGPGERVVARAVAVHDGIVYVAGGTSAPLGTSALLGGNNVFVAEIAIADATAGTSAIGSGCP